MLDPKQLFCWLYLGLLLPCWATWVSCWAYVAHFRVVENPTKCVRPRFWHFLLILTHVGVIVDYSGLIFCLFGLTCVLLKIQQICLGLFCPMLGPRGFIWKPVWATWASFWASRGPLGPRLLEIQQNVVGHFGLTLAPFGWPFCPPGHIYLHSRAQTADDFLRRVRFVGLPILIRVTAHLGEHG